VNVNDSALLDYCRKHEREHLATLERAIAIQSVSADPNRRDEVRRCGQAFVERMREVGLTAELLETGGNPIAFGEWTGAPGAPTLLIYGHYDVQPEDPIELWESPPFEATIRDGKVYGRGAVDDKGQALMHLAALEAHMKTHGRLPINVKVCFEGEEEIGSPSFEAAVERYRDKFAADVAVISDTGMFAKDIPSLTTSLRGLVHWEITVDGPSVDLHSGYFGGVVRNPIEALAHIIAALKDADGRVRVPGFYDGVPELDETTLSELRALPYDEAREARGMGVPQLWGEPDQSPLARLWFRPTMECNGIWGGYNGPGSKTIVPSWAKAKISARLVGAQDPKRVRELVRSFIEANAPAGVRVSVEDDGTVRPIVASREHAAVAAAARAMEYAFGKAPVFVGNGGSIGPAAIFDQVLGIPQVLIGVGLPDDSIHAPNEKFDLDQFYGGIRTAAIFYDELARESVVAS
jgi:acetylornithine deacetylase/succinyl-diaminopimelate desuccinylase-like protein